jgi:hypothetical protein
MDESCGVKQEQEQDFFDKSATLAKQMKNNYINLENLKRKSAVKLDLLPLPSDADADAFRLSILKERQALLHQHMLAGSGEAAIDLTDEIDDTAGDADAALLLEGPLWKAVQSTTAQEEVDRLVFKQQMKEMELDRKRAHIAKSREDRAKKAKSTVNALDADDDFWPDQVEDEAMQEHADFWPDQVEDEAMQEQADVWPDQVEDEAMQEQAALGKGHVIAGSSGEAAELGDGAAGQ